MLEDIGSLILFLVLAIGIPKLCFAMMKILLLLPSLEHGKEKSRVIASKKRVEKMFYLDMQHMDRRSREDFPKENQKNKS
ncbi:hypothetical protein TUMEXPCC7403_17670 [Tumidithrix helvetica PCC 7403]|uniref:hypothetical protein n=1 Tax=Tumidithrix helvetica TaxID=3457545 RepID=UPI003C9B8C08